MATTYPVHVEIRSPAQYDRIQLLLRIFVSIVAGWVGVTAGWLVLALYLILPVFAAIVLSTNRERYLGDVAPRVWRVLAWLLHLSAYMMLLVDRFPTGEHEDRVVIELAPSGQPTVGSALARLVTSIPSGIVLMLMWFVSSILCFVAMVLVLFTLTIPDGLLGFQRAVMRWQARLVAYHGSLVAEYPPFELDTAAPPPPVVAHAG